MRIVVVSAGLIAALMGIAQMAKKTQEGGEGGMILEENNQKLKALRERGHAVILGIETSCDETAAAVIRDRRIVCSNVLYTQIEIHAKYGGVVPEIASRNHVEKLPYIVKKRADTGGDGTRGY